MYSAGQYIYVNHRLPVPAPPPPDASPRERLAYDKANLWVAWVAEIRAVSRNEIFVRVFWLYWPDELPSGRRPYHGERELVMSNHVGIIKADTIACPADVSHWDENDDSNQKVLSERYWRQTLDVTKKDHLAKLSKLRTFCICGKYDDPNVDLFQCRVAECATWNHEDCLIADIERRAWAKFKAGELGHETLETENQKTLSRRVVEKVGQLVGNGVDVPELEDEAPLDRVPTSSKRNKRSKAVAGQKAPWNRKLEGRIKKVPKAGDETTLLATIRQKVPTPEASVRMPFEPRIWNVKLRCLKCRHSLN
jgi:hypothetical protein